MLTKFNADKLAKAYNMSDSNFHRFLKPHRDELNKLATYIGGKVKTQTYNTEQLLYIIENVMPGEPEGFEFDGKTLVKIETQKQNK